MAKNKKAKKSKDNIEVQAAKARKRANIIVGIVAGIAAIILIAVAVLSTVHVDPLDKLDKPSAAAGSTEHYDLYNLSSSSPISTNDGAQSKIRSALSGMDFSVMNAVLQWNWDYSYNFSRNKNGKKIELTAAQVDAISAASDAYMVEYVYKNAEMDENGELIKSTAHKLVVDGETVYFDRVKVLITDTKDSVGEIYMYPYIYDCVKNRVANGGLTYENYRVTAVKVRANTTSAFAALADVVESINRG